MTVPELFDIFKARMSVFVVEQSCPYQDIDEADREAYHVCIKDGGMILAYLRVLPKGTVHGEVSLGRVLTLKRGAGLGTKLLACGIETAREKFGARRIVIGAQSYARGFYEKSGFTQISDEYTEDGIPHIRMILELDAQDKDSKKE